MERAEPDYMLFAKMTGTVLEVSDGCVMYPNPEIHRRMSGILTSRLKPKSERRCLEAFGGNMTLALEFMEQRLAALNNNETWRARIQREERSARIKVENLVDFETPPSDFDYITVCGITVLH